MGVAIKPWTVLFTGYYYYLSVHKWQIICTYKLEKKFPNRCLLIFTWKFTCSLSLTDLASNCSKWMERLWRVTMHFVFSTDLWSLCSLQFVQNRQSCFATFTGKITLFVWVWACAITVNHYKTTPIKMAF